MLHGTTFIMLNLAGEYPRLVYTTQVNSAFGALWLVHSEVISQHYSPPSNWRERFLNFRPLVTLKITFWSANYSACVVYTKTIIHRSGGESDGYIHHYSPPLRWIIVKYSPIFKTARVAQNIRRIINTTASICNENVQGFFLPGHCLFQLKT